MTNAPQVSILSRLRYMSAYLNPALRRIADRVLRSPEEIKSISIKDLAAECQVSESTVTRFVREIEVPSFQHFKILIAEELSQKNGGGAPAGPVHVYEDLEEGDDSATVIGKITSRYVVTAQDTAAALNAEAVEKAVAAIEAASTVAFYATGASILCVENALLRFMRVGKSCQFFRDANVRHVSTATLGPGKLAIGVSNSGRSISTVDALRAARGLGATTLGITSFADSPLVRHCDICLFTPTVTGLGGSADYAESMVSKIAQLQVIDILYSIYALRNRVSAIEGLTRTSDVTARTRY